MATNRLSQVNIEAVVSNEAHVRLSQVSTEFVCSVSYGLVHVYGGNFQEATTTPVANGRLVIKLYSDGQQSFIPGQVVAGMKTTLTLDSTGNVPLLPARYLWANSALTPSTSTYSFMLYASDGRVCWRKPLVATIPDQSSYDLSLLPWS